MQPPQQWNTLQCGLKWGRVVTFTEALKSPVWGIIDTSARARLILHVQNVVNYIWTTWITEFGLVAACLQAIPAKVIYVFSTKYKPLDTSDHLVENICVWSLSLTHTRACIHTQTTPPPTPPGVQTDLERATLRSSLPPISINSS